MQTEIKKFTRHITGDELIAACERECFPCQPRKYLEEGSDHIRFGFQHGRIFVSALYNTVSGRAFGEYAQSTGKGALKKGTDFSTDDKLDGTPWFDALLSFLYVA
ncbi:hypothetical protein [Burkholderia mayonis]|uniref:Uncharacterized protein n=1 Tax=Burkholderia mayonis TaxID=1385591 RepID=A0A1B4G140_9BURK|nr:hypothetical protein [Burkholderia mayonis]AOJ09639.1 hypothetical protein WS71_20205 [Burkholderia mayonis]KVE52260.1 hypothetical protein WS71_10030 [Burkholderia mayonis]